MPSERFDTTPIPGIHPLLDRQFTPRDCYEFSVLTGIGPQIIAGILTGRIQPDTEVCPRLDEVLGEGVIAALREDYDPFRDMQFIDPEQIDGRFRLEEHYPVTLIKAGDCIRTRDDRWVVISRVRLTPQRVRLFSGPTLCAVTKRDNRAIVAVRISEKVPTQVLDNDRRIQVDRVRQAFDTEVLDTDREHRMDYVRDILAAARARREVEDR